MEPTGTIVFASVGVTGFGFDVFSVAVPASPGDDVSASKLDERRHTDGVSVNFNAQFSDDAGDVVAFVSERTGAAALFLSRPGSERPEPLPAAEGSLFHDRPTVRGGRVYFVSAHEKPPQPFRSWAAVYMADLGSGDGEVTRVTPRGVVDMSPAVSASGELVAVASYGDRPWAFDFRVLETEVAVFRAADPARRVVAAARGGWPTWHGEGTLFFHRVADDGWWSVFRVDISPETLEPTGPERRVTPPGLHCFTPAAVGRGGRWIAVTTRRKGRAQRHVELFDLETEQFSPLTELLNPELHHYNPFFSPSGGRLGYHRFRGAGAAGDSVVPHLQPVRSPVPSIRMLRVHGTFPSFSPDASHLAINGDFFTTPGVMVLRSDGSKRWTISKEPNLFYTTWSPTEPGVVFTSMGPIFETPKATVRIARVEFDPSDLTDDREEVSGATVKVLTRPEAGNDAFPAVSPCGRWLVFRSGRTGHKNLYIVDAARGEQDSGDDGSAITRLTEGEWIDTMPSWSPDGRLIAFSSNRHDPANPNVFSIYLVRPDGSGLRRVYVAGPEGSAEADKERINHVCFSPDSRWLLFTANLGGVMAEPIAGPNQFQPYGDLYVCRLDGSGLLRLTCNAYENGTPAWGPESAGMGVESLSLGPPAGEKEALGQFDEPLWLTCDV
uniref:Dipeptidylpeptidase IV N-terminal domain-containing protein n=1 Tax=Arundo donax TaxID=35708 RepID=A0A0A9FTQ5_ARUDO